MGLFASKTVEVSSFSKTNDLGRLAVDFANEDQVVGKGTRTYKIHCHLYKEQVNRELSVLYLAECEDHKYAFIAWKGTNSIEQTIVDLEAKLKSYESWNQLLRTICSGFLSELTTYLTTHNINAKDYEWYTTGHSLGGALAFYSAYMISCDPSLINHGKFIAPITFASMKLPVPLPLPDGKDYVTSNEGIIFFNERDRLVEFASEEELQRVGKVIVDINYCLDGEKMFHALEYLNKHYTVLREDHPHDYQILSEDVNMMIAGGYDAIYATEGILTTYNIISGVFDTNYPKMNVGRGDTQVAGGWTGDNFITPSDVVEKYSYTKNTWTQVKSLHYGRGDLACGVLAGTIFAIGGETRPASDISHTHSVPVKVVERYLPWNDSWVFEESIPDNVFRFIGASWNSSLNIYTSSIFLFGGQGTFNNISDIFPVKNTTIQYIPQSTVQSSSSSKLLPPESIAGIVIGVVVGVGAIIFIIVIYFTRKHFLYVSLKEEEPSLPRAFDAVMIGGEGDKKQAEALHYLEQEELRDAFPSYHNDQKNKNQSKAVVRYDVEAAL
eukprot:gene8494-9190_t